jgi:hypothetical protein
MKSTYVDDGDVVCPVCGARNNFTDRRSGKGKIAGGVLAPKRLRCNGCGTSLKRGDTRSVAPAAKPLTNVQAAKLLTKDGMTLTEVNQLRKDGVDLDALVRERGLI